MGNRVCIIFFVGKRLLNCGCNRATTLYDKPPEMFKSLDEKQKQGFLNSLGEKYKEQLSESGIESLIDGGEKNNRPGILVSSTSWTEDEDFSVLLSALEGINS